MMKKSIIFLAVQLLSTLVSVVQSVVSVNIQGENVYPVEYEDMQYFLFIEDKEATITCTVTGTGTVPQISFKKEGRSLDTVLPDTLYKLDAESSGQSHSLKLKIDSSGYTEIVGNWTCEVVDNTNANLPVLSTAHFNTLCTSKPSITFTPPLEQGVARQGTTITMRCDCDALDDLANQRKFSWIINNATPAGSKISYEGPGSEDGYPTNQLVVSNLDSHDSAAYRCVCTVGENFQFTSNDVQMSVMRPPRIPIEIVLSSATMSTLSIAWKNSDNMGVVLGYQISYKKDGDSRYIVISTRASTADYILSDLEPLTSYSIKIAASNNAGSGAYSNVVTFSTSQPSESRPRISIPRNNVYRRDDDMTYKVEVAKGVEVALRCEVRSYPASIVEWMFNGRKLETQPASDLPDNYERSLHVKSQFETEHTLYIKSSRKVNSGSYTCVATNTKGKDTLKFKVSVDDVDKDGSAEENKLPNSDQSLSSLLWLHVLLVTLFSAVLL